MGPHQLLRIRSFAEMQKAVSPNQSAPNKSQFMLRYDVMNGRPRILIVDDSVDLLKTLILHLRTEFDVVSAISPAEALKVLDDNVLVALVDERMTGASGVQFLEQLKKDRPAIKRILMTGYGDDCLTRASNNADIHSYIAKPPHPDYLSHILRGAVDAYHLAEQRDSLAHQKKSLLKKEGLGFESIIGQSPLITNLIKEALQIVDHPGPVLIQGETGTGKDWLAQAIHYGGFSRRGLIWPINCGSLTETLLPSEMFGTKKESFTGAIDRKGHLEEADQGTLFLDEIGEMTPAFQSLLLRVLDGNAFSRVGTTKPIKVDVRVICATNRNLESEVKEGRFRADLYYRINKFKLLMPPLRDRSEDIPLLAKYFLERFIAVEHQRGGLKNGQEFKTILGFSDAAIKALQQYTFPGNVRELLSIVEGSAIRCRQRYIEPDDLRIDSPKAENIPGNDTLNSLPERVLHFECGEVRKAMLEARGRQEDAAKLLGIELRTLQNKLKKCRDCGLPV